MAIGLSPAGQQLFSSISPGVAPPGLGDLLRGQVQDETDELRKKRLAQMQAGGSLAAGTRAAMASPLGPYIGLATYSR
jgi:hypothetical protein